MESDNAVDPEQARIILGQELRDRERRCADQIQKILEKEGFKLEIKPQIVLVPIR